MKVETYYDEPDIEGVPWNAFVMGNNGEVLLSVWRPTKKEAKRALKELLTQAYIEVCIPKKTRKYIEKYNKGEK